MSCINGNAHSRSCIANIAYQSWVESVGKKVGKGVGEFYRLIKLSIDSSTERV